MPLTEVQKDISYVALLVAISQPRSENGQASYLEILRATPDPKTITNDNEAKELFTKVDPVLYAEVHSTTSSLNSSAYGRAERKLARIYNHMREITETLREDHEWAPRTVCGNMVKVIAKANEFV
jgi:hypothetical protein